MAQDEEDGDFIVVQGIRGSLGSALNEKRQAPNLVEVIKAEDIGKLPDQNLAEVLENITGVQITREAGVGKGVQIRGTNANRTEINGVSTVGSGSGRSGISFEDVSADSICEVNSEKRLKEHKDIATALRKRDPERARKAMRTHFKCIIEAMLAAAEAQAIEEARRRTQESRERFLNGVAAP